MQTDIACIKYNMISSYKYSLYFLFLLFIELKVEFTPFGWSKFSLPNLETYTKDSIEF